MSLCLSLRGWSGAERSGCVGEEGGAGNWVGVVVGSGLVGGRRWVKPLYAHTWFIRIHIPAVVPIRIQHGLIYVGIKISGYGGLPPPRTKASTIRPTATVRALLIFPFFFVN